MDTLVIVTCSNSARSLLISNSFSVSAFTKTESEDWKLITRLVSSYGQHFLPLKGTRHLYSTFSMSHSEEQQYPKRTPSARSKSELNLDLCQRYSYLSVLYVETSEAWMENLFISPVNVQIPDEKKQAYK